MKTLRWLHIADLHCGMSAETWIWPSVFEEFLKDLSAMHGRCGPWDLLIFSGDLVQSGMASEFKILDENLERISRHLLTLGSRPLLLVVPGNHDLQRPQGTDPARTDLVAWAERGLVPDDFWSQSGHPVRKLLRKAFRNYTSWAARGWLRRVRNLQKGTLPGEFAATIEKDGSRIGVIGLNSTYMQVQAGDYEGKLVVSPNQLAGACGKTYVEWLQSHEFCLLVTHQPWTWLSRAAQRVFREAIAPPGRFAAHLSGHLHETYQESTSIGGAESTRTLQSASLFGLEEFGDGRPQERRHGYMIGELQWDDVGGKLRVWPRIAQRHQYGHWHFVPDPSATLDDDGGTRPETVRVNKRITSAVSGQSPFTVLLVSSQRDLGDARRSIAEHLIRSLGVRVVETTGTRGGVSPDLLVLLQAWWWENGESKDAWQMADPATRCAFVVDEEADWPPRRLIELAADAEVKAFRATLSPSVSFKRVEELPELVSAAVTRRIRVSHGTPDLGLREWERTYLDFRLPAWRSGRTARSQPHLFDVEQAQELYQPDLYISLEGTSRDWRRGKDGNPQRSPRGTRRASRPVWAETASARTSLARWLCVPTLPRVALVGAPGGGKTIFLTRIAATLAYSCLGRAGNLEPDFDAERLRRNSALPIPIIVEATRIASKDLSKVDAIVESIVDEVSSSGNAACNMDQVKLDLKSGRYFLLIDALDEIADTNDRSRVLALIKGMASPTVFPLTRVLLTTRSARYTGSLQFGPELETVEVAPLSRRQVTELCSAWSNHRQRDDAYKTTLSAAVDGLAERVEGSADDQALTENPLMLTAICMVFERYRSLPDDRGRLCELLIDDLCHSRRSEDLDRGWKLDETAKKDLLQRVALAMQEEGAQSWRVSRAIEIAMQIVPAADPSRQQRAKRYLDWAADHTGILRFQEAPQGQEQIRFWHRLFREYLSASRLAQEDSTAESKIDQLWETGRLLDPFWEDVVRLLPRSLATIEKSKSMLTRRKPSVNTAVLCGGRPTGQSGFR